MMWRSENSVCGSWLCLSSSDSVHPCFLALWVLWFDHSFMRCICLHLALETEGPWERKCSMSLLWKQAQCLSWLSWCLCYCSWSAVAHLCPLHFSVPFSVWFHARGLGGELLTFSQTPTDTFMLLACWVTNWPLGPSAHCKWGLESESEQRPPPPCVR